MLIAGPEDQQKQLDDDLATHNSMQAHPGAQGQSLSFGFAMHSFDETAWKTAQTTGAFAYMQYADASRYADIYTGQEQFVQMERDVIDDLACAMSVTTVQPANWRPTPPQIGDLRNRIGMLKMRLYLLSSFMDALDNAYHKV